MNHPKPSTEAVLLLHALYALEINIKNVYFLHFFYFLFRENLYFVTFSNYWSTWKKSYLKPIYMNMKPYCFIKQVLSIFLGKVFNLVKLDFDQYVNSNHMKTILNVYTLQITCLRSNIENCLELRLWHQLLVNSNTIFLNEIYTVHTVYKLLY